MANFVKESIENIQTVGFKVFCERAFQYAIFKTKRKMYGYDTENTERFHLLKGKYSGKRIFILGNGPSINKQPLYLLKNEYKMCFNRFHLLAERVGWYPELFAITDDLGLTAQGLETVIINGSDRILLKKIDELLTLYKIDTIVVGMPYNMDGTKSQRVLLTEKFIHKLKCKYNKLKIDYIDERLTTVEAHKTMNFLDIKRHKKRNIVDTISAVYILETYIEKQKNLN